MAEMTAGKIINKVRARDARREQLTDIEAYRAAFVAYLRWHGRMLLFVFVPAFVAFAVAIWWAT